jgi:hypothetical protein
MMYDFKDRLTMPEVLPRLRLGLEDLRQRVSIWVFLFNLIVNKVLPLSFEWIDLKG